jgi:hypothetical protein
MTVFGLVERYEAIKAPNLKMGRETMRLLRRHVEPAIGKLAVAEVTGDHIRRLIHAERERLARDDKALREAGRKPRTFVLVNRIFAACGSIFTFALDENLIPLSPMPRMRRGSGMLPAENAKSRTFADEEIATFWNRIDETGMDARTRAALKLNGDVFLFDVGTNTKYVWRESAQSAFQDDVYPSGSFTADDDDEADRPSSKADTTAVESEDDSPDEIDEYLIARKMPDIDPRAFYGPLREIVEAATKNSEATRVGVALQVIAQVSMCLRPFYIDLGDASLPLNFFALQIGRSGLGRKGTSAAFADQHLAPMIRAVAEDVRSLTLLAAADANEQAAAQQAVQEAEDRIDWVQGLGINDLLQVDTEIEALQKEQATAQANVGAWRTKIAAKTYAPTTYDSYERKITESEAKIASLKDRLADLAVERSRVEAVIKDPDGQLAAAEKTAAAFRARHPSRGKRCSAPWLTPQ